MKKNWLLSTQKHSVHWCQILILCTSLACRLSFLGLNSKYLIKVISVHRICLDFHALIKEQSLTNSKNQEWGWDIHKLRTPGPCIMRFLGPRKLRIMQGPKQLSLVLIFALLKFCVITNVFYSRFEFFMQFAIILYTKLHMYNFNRLCKIPGKDSQ